MQVDYEIRRERRRSISLHVSKDLKLIVKAPFGVSTETVLDFMKEKKSWILKQLEKASKQKELALEMGFLTPEELKEIRKNARKIFPERVEYYAKLGGISYGKISYRFQKTRWGSCTSSGNLSFNCLLVLMPPEVLDSVVVHELCHRLYMNHSRDFYDAVTKLYPEYKKYHKWLNENGPAYTQRLPTE